jgi:uncharacterized protein
MKIRRIFATALAFGFLLLPLIAHAQAPTHRVLFALLSADETDWRITVGNIQNLIKGLQPETVQIEVVAYGPGLSFVKKGSTYEKEIIALMPQNVRFVACENAMRMQHVTVADLIPGVEPVPAGIVEVVKKQEQGWTYIKAGR